MALERYIQNRLNEKDILLMTHIVLGYPSFKDSVELIQEMVAGGVDLMELQIPFSEPTADGPVIVKANQRALERGARIKDCLNVAKQAAGTFDIPFLIMTYYNIPFIYGLKRFLAAISDYGIRGAIIPDLPPEEGRDYLDKMNTYDLAPILIFSPTTSFDRMHYIATFAKGFIYCVSRKGVTGQNTDFSEKLRAYLVKCRKATSLPLAVGFGVKSKSDVDFLKCKADIAVIGSETLRMVEQKGIASVKDFIRSLR
ncbi:MAG: tryptophan synthase subunit alpha [Desulfobacterales bacterium]